MTTQLAFLALLSSKEPIRENRSFNRAFSDYVDRKYHVSFIVSLKTHFDKTIELIKFVVIVYEAIVINAIKVFLKVNYANLERNVF